MQNKQTAPELRTLFGFMKQIFILCETVPVSPASHFLRPDDVSPDRTRIYADRILTVTVRNRGRVSPDNRA